MTAISPSELIVGNIVLIESHVRRWSTKKDQTERGWTEWGVKLDLQCVSLLHPGIAPSDAMTSKDLTPFKI